MKYKTLLLITTLLLSITQVFSQRDLKNGIFFELGGNAYYYSINYERQFKKKVIGRIGAGYLYNTIVIPLTIGKIYGGNQHHIEIAGGLDFAKSYETRNSIRTTTYYTAITGFVGYRYQKPEKKFFLKAGFTPLWSVYESSYNIDITETPFYPWGGIGLGSRF